MKSEIEAVRVEIPSVTLAAVRLTVVGGLGQKVSESHEGAVLLLENGAALLWEDGTPVLLETERTDRIT